MPRAPNPNVKQAEQMFLAGCKLIDIARELDIPEGTVRRWKSTYKWDGDTERSDKNKTNVRKKAGAPKNNKNAVGHGAPKGNLNPLKHGAYQNIYLDALPEEEQELYNQIDPTVELDNEIKLLRLKISRLLNRDKTFFYDMFGKKQNIDIKEEDREQGIVICIQQLEKLIKTKASIMHDTTKFEYQKHKDEIELEIKVARLELDKAKANMDDDIELEDDGFLDALSAEVENVWQD